MTHEYLQYVFRQLCISKKKNHILVDFNCDLLLKGGKLSSMLKNNKLVQIIDVPPRVTSTSATLLDLLIMNTSDAIIAKSVVPQLISDHDLISTKVNITKPRRLPQIKSFRQLRHYNKDIYSE